MALCVSSELKAVNLKCNQAIPDVHMLYCDSSTGVCVSVWFEFYYRCHLKRAHELPNGLAHWVVSAPILLAALFFFLLLLKESS